MLWGACDALFTPRPLGPLHDIARQTQGALLTAVTSGGSRDAIFTATLDELERARTLAVFEDMHWADEATLDLLKYLGRRIERTRAMLVVTYREDEVGARHPLRSVIGDLPHASIRENVACAAFGGRGRATRRAAGRPSKGLHRITAGNPFFVTEVLAAPPTPYPSQCARRCSRMSPSCRLSARDIAELVCVVPGKTEGWLLAETSGPRG